MAERLLESDKGAGRTATDTRVNQDLGNDQGVEREETDSYNEVIFGRRRPDSIAIDWNNKILHVLEFKRTSDQRHTYRERGESRARVQHDVLVRSLEKVAEEATRENRGWKIKLIIFVGDTCGSVHTQTFNNNLKELGVVESKRNSIRKGLVHELLNAQDTVLCSYFCAEIRGAADSRVGQLHLKVGVRLRGGQRKTDGKQAKQAHRSTLLLRRKGGSGVWQPQSSTE